MKLVRYNSGRIGVLHDGSVYDATAAFGVDPTAWPPVGMVQAIAKFDATRDALKSLLKGPGLPLDKVDLETPILWRTSSSRIRSITMRTRSR
ncbi:MAG: hypothetical protein WDN69_32640 [Aliidongia sp.]